MSLRGQGFSVATRTGRYSLPGRRGENLVLSGANGSRFVANKPFEEGLGVLGCWVLGATNEVITNLAVDPAPVNLGTTAGLGWQGSRWYGSGTATGTYSLVAGATPWGGPQFIRKTWTSGGGTTNGDTGFDHGSATNTIATTPGEWITVTTNLRTSASGKVATISGYEYPNGIRYSSPAYAMSPASWMPIRWTFQVRPGVTSMTFASDIAAQGTLWVAGDTLDGGGLTVTRGTAAPSFFSGDSASDGTFVYRWSGVAYASASTRTDLRAITIPNTIAGQRQAFEDNMARLMRCFTRAHRLSTLRAAQPDGSIRRAFVEWNEWSDPDVSAGGTRAEFSIGYVVPAVWWEDETTRTQAATANATLPKTLDLTSFTGMTGIIEDAVLTVTGPITNPRITDSETGGYVQFTGTVPTGQTWVVDVGAFTSSVAGASVLANTTHSGGYKFLVIPNCFGATDTPRLVLSGSAGGAATNLSVTARRKWANG